MGLIKKIDHHADLLMRMAETVHADLGASLEAGVLQGEALRGAIFTCMGCASASECPSWIDAHSQGTPAAPDFCRNKAWLARLSA